MHRDSKFSFTILLTLIVYLFSIPAYSQNQAEFNWYEIEPKTSAIIQGQPIVSGEPIGFGRLPETMKPVLRTAVWDLGKHMAGTYIEFKSNSAAIQVLYHVTGSLNMAHMPSTGVSGLDLYQSGADKTWTWIPARYSFKDTISFQYDKLDMTEGKVYRLYLPLYNGLKSFKIGVPKGATLQMLERNPQGPIVVYGTSIAQGGCASRPGLAWPSILGRLVNKEVINLGFSGNGRLEQPLIDLMIAQKPSIYILDCLPNMGSATLFPDTTLIEVIKSAVRQIRIKDGLKPIILSQHSGSRIPQLRQVEREGIFNRTSDLLIVAFNQMKKEGVKNIHLISSSDIGLDLESTVDGAHPNDIGMMKHAQAYQKLLKKIRQD